MVRQPDNAALAFLLGTAIGVMATLSVIEMWLNNALEHGFFEVRRISPRTLLRHCGAPEGL